MRMFSLLLAVAALFVAFAAAGPPDTLDVESAILAPDTVVGVAEVDVGAAPESLCSYDEAGTFGALKRLRKDWCGAGIHPLLSATVDRHEVPGRGLNDHAC